MSRRILLIDDDSMMRELIAVLLRPRGFEIASAASAEEARERLSAMEPDLILLDLNLGGTGGLELLGELRRQVGTRTPLVVVSASSDAATREQAIPAGATGFIAKPIHPRSFAAEIEPYLKGRETPAPIEMDPRERRLIDLRRQFLETALAAIEQFKQRDDQDLLADTQLADAAHKWIGASNIEGMPDVEASAREVETLARAKRADQIAHIRQRLRVIEEQFRACQDPEVAACRI